MRVAFLAKEQAYWGAAHKLTDSRRPGHVGDGGPIAA